jgi:hypothetical protein
MVKGLKGSLHYLMSIYAVYAFPSFPLMPCDGILHLSELFNKNFSEHLFRSRCTTRISTSYTVSIWYLSTMIACSPNNCTHMSRIRIWNRSGPQHQDPTKKIRIRNSGIKVKPWDRRKAFHSYKIIQLSSLNHFPYALARMSVQRGVKGALTLPNCTIDNHSTRNTRSFCYMVISLVGHIDYRWFFYTQ